MTGAANRLSVGMSKKPWIWPACRSTVMTRSTPGSLDQVGNQLGRDGGARAGPAILPGVTEVRHDGRDAPRHRALQCVDQDQQLHEVVVGGERGRLQDVDVLAAHVLLHLDEHLHVGEAPDDALGERELRGARDRLCQAGGCCCRQPASCASLPDCGLRLAYRRASAATLRSPVPPSSKRHRRVANGQSEGVNKRDSG